MTNEEKALVWYKARNPDVYLANPTWVSRDLAAYAEEQNREITAQLEKARKELSKSEFLCAELDFGAGGILSQLARIKCECGEIAAYAAGLKAALEKLQNPGMLGEDEYSALANVDIIATGALAPPTPEAAALAAAAMEVGHAYVGWLHRTSGEDPVEYGRLERILDDADERYLAIREKAKS